MIFLTVLAGVPLVQPVADTASAPVTENLLALIAGAAVGAGTITAIVLLFFINAMSKNRNLTYQMRDQLSRQITSLTREFHSFGSRHNREDDDRFDFLKIQNWQMAVKLAKIEGLPAPVLETFPRRRYLDENADQISDVKGAGMVPTPDSS